MKVGAIIPAAGRGARIGAAVPKQFLELQGKPLLHHTLKVFAACEVIDYVVLVMPQADVDESGDEWLHGCDI
ncbi:MAG TPA: 2-C-methyl-D-erythritol 4-phosphate cytidylyltransferase, partial [Nitrospinaceae bacterium]|nr:2-C-methyl-D-erythritol 4-phosphate cytidylyltransferase [Nitrospinaceae bacterium]